MRIIRMPVLVSQYGEPASTTYWRISRGEQVPPVKLGPRAAGWIEEEVEQVARARAAGKSTEEIRALVRRLVEARKQGAPGGAVDEVSGQQP